MSRAANQKSIARLRISEIFYSIQGEASHVGWPTIFIRLTGCPLRCQYCDTAYALRGGQWHSLAAIFDELAKYHTRYVTVTGGEPLAQPESLRLLRELCDQDYIVSLETSGALSMKDVDTRVIKVMDIKTPDSGEVAKNDKRNLQYLSDRDQIKFVICSHQDYEWAKEMVLHKQLDRLCTVYFSAVDGQLEPAHLAHWILEDQLPIRFQIQMHKVLWGNEPGH